ncbi:hypothetical protein CDEE_0903 [Candidatus Kinetoplastibacterium crithidii TCC036E]|uniref:Transmembrane protein n=1 Tax=Candidatus Kinetoplastidibacterium crithidiae TCC036E TaxID=1208918 RepID=M1M6Z8_9PROT|nr:hypothetical protein CDEE_0903 [Candidatus Kinetoplastibacterium crithidii TCC036E]
MSFSDSSSSGFFSNPKTITKIVYILFALGFITSGFFWPSTLLSVVIIYNKRGELGNAMYVEHFDWLLYTFWLSLFLITLGLILTFIYIGYLVILLTVVWVMYRLVKGFSCLCDEISPYNTNT